MQHADGVGLRIVGAEGIGADEFGEILGLVRVRAANGTHLVQDDGNACFGELPCSFGTGETAANDVYGCV